MRCCAIIGVHDWEDAFGNGRDYAPGRPEHRENVAYYEEMLGTAEMYWFTIRAAPADAIHIMSRAELDRYGVFTEAVR